MKPLTISQEATYTALRIDNDEKNEANLTRWYGRKAEYYKDQLIKSFSMSFPGDPKSWPNPKF